MQKKEIKENISINVKSSSCGKGRGIKMHNKSHQHPGVEKKIQRGERREEKQEEIVKDIENQ